jgi:hypothetical protein
MQRDESCMCPTHPRSLRPKGGSCATAIQGAARSPVGHAASLNPDSRILLSAASETANSPSRSGLIGAHFLAL